MAKVVRKKNQAKAVKVFASPFEIYWTKNNYVLLIVSVLAAVAGYYFLSVKPWNSSTSLYLAPLLLLVVYVVLFPLSILYKKKESKEQE